MREVTPIARDESQVANEHQRRVAERQGLHAERRILKVGPEGVKSEAEIALAAEGRVQVRNVQMS